MSRHVDPRPLDRGLAWFVIGYVVVLVVIAVVTVTAWAGVW